jgi:hypothetical protein
MNPFGVIFFIHEKLCRQTGSGKTYSMGTGSEPYLNSDNQGIIHRFAHSLFGMMKQQTENYKYQVYLSYLELYNEEINDLLATKNDTEQHPSIREDTQGKIYWANVKEENVQTAEELLR